MLIYITNIGGTVSVVGSVNVRGDIGINMGARITIGVVGC